jgi:succinyl-diaminopimelate desuccinylase
MSDVLELTKNLIARVSVTPEDAGCQALMSERMKAKGFNCQQLDYGDTKNLFVTHGTQGPVMIFLGHTDVVPPGPRDQWHTDPFEPVIKDGYLYGRGAADMKGSVAAFVVALEKFVEKHPDHPGTVGMLITSDEEGDALDGVRKVAEHFKTIGQKIDYCITGEPSSIDVFGDLLRVGRRGTLSGTLKVKGIQGHVAYPERARNPIHDAMLPMAELAARVWDNGYSEATGHLPRAPIADEPAPDFPRSSFQISNINAGTGANNVIPGECSIVFNFRYNPGWKTDDLISEVHKVCDAHGLDYEIKWHRGGEPFLTGDGALRKAVRETIIARLGITPIENTGGGTSDARFIAPLGAEVVEMGPINASIHKVNERVALSELEQLPDLFCEFTERLMLKA